jgi:predicted nucleic acid-binding protein
VSVSQLGSVLLSRGHRTRHGFWVFDLHLVVTACERGADIVCSSNTRHLAEGELAGGLEILRAGRLARELGLS